MFKHTAVILAAVASSLAAAQGLKQLKPAQAQTALSAQAAADAGSATPGRAARISKSSDGHFWAEAEDGGRPVRLLVDTGASAVALTPADAARLGVDLRALDYGRPISTAAGETRGAPVMLEHLSIRGARVDHVQALVVREGLKTSLLGMSYLGRLSRIEADRTGLVLQP